MPIKVPVNRLKNLWPLGAIAVGLLVTIAWISLLAWMAFGLLR